MTYYITMGGIVLVCVIWFVLEALTAPHGYEDENGFHYGNPHK